MKNRRDFLKQTTFLCGGALLAGAAITTEACKTKAVAATTTTTTTTPANTIALVDGKVKIPVSEFSAANAKVYEPATGFKLLVNKNADGTYSAFEYKCPHAGGPLEKKGEELVCPWHDSRFKLDGSLIKGPAVRGLTTYPATVEGTDIVVKVS